MTNRSAEAQNSSPTKHSKINLVVTLCYLDLQVQPILLSKNIIDFKGVILFHKGSDVTLECLRAPLAMSPNDVQIQKVNIKYLAAVKNKMCNKLTIVRFYSFRRECFCPIFSLASLAKFKNFPASFCSAFHSQLMQTESRSFSLYSSFHILQGHQVNT